MTTFSLAARTAALVGLLVPLASLPLNAQARAPRPPVPADPPSAPRPAARVYVNGESMANRPYLGIVLRGSDGPADTLGLLVAEVEADLPAAKAGITSGARLVSIDGVDLRLDPRDVGDDAAGRVPESRLRRQLERKESGDTVTLVVLTDGRRETRRVALGESPMARTFRTMSNARRVVGVGFSQRGSMRDTAGLLITSVTSGGAAEKAGLTEGDRVVSIDGVDLRVPATDAGTAEGVEARVSRFRRALEAARDSQPIRLDVISEGRRRTVSVRPSREQGWSFNSAQLGDMAERMRDAIAGQRRYFSDGGDEAMRERAEAPRERAGGVRERAEAQREGVRAQVELQREMGRLQRDIQRDVQREMTRAQRERFESGRDDDDDRDDARGRGSSADDETRSARGAIRGRTDGATMVLGGLSLAAVDRDFAQQFGRGSERGALVVRSRDAWAPLRAGDVILTIDGRSVRDGNSLDVTFDRSRDQRLEILRNGDQQTITLPASR